ncbi:MAG: hypothetical protein M3R38_19820, partial [Actinomycetota bacterium]|nr:hypothetical protein [Actinomycetota bacterium]
ARSSFGTSFSFLLGRFGHALMCTAFEERSTSYRDEIIVRASSFVLRLFSAQTRFAGADDGLGAVEYSNLMETGEMW